MTFLFVISVAIYSYRQVKHGQFIFQNNNNGGYNVGDKNQASNSEETQFNMVGPENKNF
jgi:hypothetical protein